MPRTAVIRPRGTNHTISSRSSAENVRQARRPVCTATTRATKIAAKHKESEQDVFPQIRVIDERAKKHEEKCAQQKGQFSVKGEHLVVVMIGQSDRSWSWTGISLNQSDPAVSSK